MNKQIPKSRKLDSRAHLGQLVGYGSTNIFRIWVPSKNKIVKTRNVTFDEDKFYDPRDLDLGAILRESAENLIQTLELPEWKENESDLEEECANEVEIPSEPSIKYEELAQLERVSPTPKSTPATKSENAVPVGTKTESKKINSNIDKSNIIEGKRVRKPNNLVTFHDSFATAIYDVKPNKLHRNDLPPPPKNHKEVIQHRFSSGFKAAEEKELKTLFEKKLCFVISKEEMQHMKIKGELDPEKITLALLWVYTYKFDANGYLLSFKARLVARGDLQSTTDETYAATLAAQVFRATMAISAVYEYKIRQYDVVAAYTNADLPRPIVTHLPEGFQKYGDFLLIRKALYGLPESALLWQNHLQSTLIDIGLFPIPGVNCLFTNKHLIVLFYVDDIIVIYHERDSKSADSFEEKLMKTYQIKPLGQIDHFIGIRVVRDELMRKIWLVQDSYIDSITKDFNISVKGKNKPSTPLPTTPLIKNPKQATAREISRYQRRVGKLNYAAVMTRPDIAHGVSKLSEFLQNPSQQHMEAVDHMIRYLVATKCKGIEYDGDLSNVTGRAFIASSDASFADETETRCSSSGFCFQLFGGMIHWKAIKQKSVTTSSTEAELLALTVTAKEYIWWTRLFKNLRLDLESPVILCDNQQTLRLLQKETPKLATKLKHIDIHQCWLRQEVQCGNISVEWVETKKMIADGLTKSLSPQRHLNFMGQMRLVDVVFADC